MRVLAALAVLLLGACADVETTPPAAPAAFYGTLEPFAAEAVYFIVTDRFVDGDPDNNYPDQGGEHGSFDIPVQLPGEQPANIGYLGGDFRGVLDNADYITDMGFTAVWLTPIVDNPDQAFTGGIRPGEGFGADKGKSAYHGYWGVNFFEVDEHLESDGLSFAEFAAQLESDHGLKFVLDVVCNHGSPAYTMPADQPKFGELYGQNGELLADHQNLHPHDLDPDNPLHRWFSREPDLAQLADFDPDNTEVMDYFVAAYSQWLDQGADAFRIDTVKHMPHAFWRQFAERMRAERPGLFMFAESYSFDADEIAEHTRPENGGISVLDFPGKQQMDAVFGGGAPLTELASYLHLDSGTYANPYELMTFYDNHDMPRMNATDQGFIDAHNWLFLSRGIPVVYYGSEVGFRRGTPEHGGNRDFFGQAAVDAAREHPIRAALSAVANVRKQSIALQRGLQVATALHEDTASFLRVYQHEGVAETAIVALNRGDGAQTVTLSDVVDAGRWEDAVSGAAVRVAAGQRTLDLAVPAHGFRVLLRRGAVTNPTLLRELVSQQAALHRRSRAR